jgi:hypothetical protein
MYSGDVYFDVTAKGEEPSRMRVNTVRTSRLARPRRRTETPHVTEGVGLVQSRGGQPWEGPAPDSGQPETEWGEHVTDDYRAAAEA